MAGVSNGVNRIVFDAVVERLAPEVPRFVVYPGRAWDETGTFLVSVTLNGVEVGLRSLIPWKERGWHFGLSEPLCRLARVDTGDRVTVEMSKPSDPRPHELREMLASSPGAAHKWAALTPPQQRDLILFVADAKKPETRKGRARKWLGS